MDMLPARRSAQEIADAIIEFAASKQGAHSTFLQALAKVLQTSKGRSGGAGGRYVMFPSSNGVIVQCENAVQARWFDEACRHVEVNFLTPNLRQLERELLISA